MTDGVFGVAIGGECPLKSVVSRGMRSSTTGETAVWRDGEAEGGVTIEEVAEVGLIQGGGTIIKKISEIEGTKGERVAFFVGV